MAGSLDPVTQEFIADVAGYVDALEEAIDAAHRFAEANEEAVAAAQEFSAAMDETGGSEDDLAGSTEIIVESLHELRDAFVEDADMSALMLTQLELIAEAEDETAFATKALAEETAGLRDKLLETAAAMEAEKSAAHDDAAAMVELGAATKGAKEAAGDEEAGGEVGLLGIILMLLPAMAGLLPVLASLGLGFGALALFAIPAFKQVEDYMNGTTKAVHGQAAVMVKDIKRLEKEYDALSKTFQPYVMTLFTEALTAAKILLPQLVPLAKAAAGAMSGLLQDLDKGLKTKGWHDFLNMMVKLFPPAFHALVGLVGGLIGLLVGLGKAAAGIGIPFLNIVDAILKFAGAWTIAHPAATEFLLFLAGALGALKLFGTGPLGLIIAGILLLAGALITAYQHSKKFRDIIKDIGKFLAPIAATVERFASDLLSHLVPAWETMIQTFKKNKSTIDLIVTVLKALAYLLAGAIVVAIAIVVGVLIGLMKGFDALDAALNRVIPVVKAMAKFFVASWKDVYEAVQTAGREITSALNTAIRNIEDWARNVGNWINNVIGFFEKLPGRIGSALSGLPGRLESDGLNMMMGLLRGLEAGAGAVFGEVNHIMSVIASIPSKILGMLSPSRVFMEHGKNIILGLTQGIRANAPQAYSAIAELSNNIGNQHMGTRLAMAGATNSAGTGGIVINQTVQGSVIAEQQLQQLAQQQILRYTRRNPGNGLFLPNKKS
jgi:hypothetical protein